MISQKMGREFSAWFIKSNRMCVCVYIYRPIVKSENQGLRPKQYNLNAKKLLLDLFLRRSHIGNAVY